MKTMFAVQYDRYGPPDVLHVARVPMPAPAPGQVLVKILASSVNAADVAFRSGALKLISGKRFPKGIGFDFVGDVIEVGPGVTSYLAGDGVWGFVHPKFVKATGAIAEYIAIPVEAIAQRPTTIEPSQAAALPGAGGAALGALRDALGLKPGERVLIRGAAGGVGTSALQVAKALGAHPVALASARHSDALRALGAIDVFDYRSFDANRLGRFDAILDTVGSGMKPFRRLLSPRGRMATLSPGERPGDIAYLLLSQVFGARRIRFVQSPPNGLILADLTKLVDAGQLVPVVARSYAAEDASSAHRDMEAGGGLGKRVILLGAAALA